MEIILANDFTQDTLGRRGVRLMEIQNTIASLQPSLNVSPELFNWATNCYDNYTALRTTASAELGEKEGATTELDMKEKIMRETYTDIRGIVLARYKDYPQHLDDFNLDLEFPDKTEARMAKVLNVVKISERHMAAGVPCVLPPEMQDRLRNVVADVRDAYEQKDTEKFESKHATRALWDLFDADSARLAELLNWAKVMWGRYDLRFELIGMVPMKQGSGGGGGDLPAVPEGFELKWLDPFLKLSWNPVEGATSYQLAFSADGGDTWEELYSGPELGFEYEPPAGLRQYRVRARNANGYGDWSVTLEYDIEEPAPVGSFPAELSGLYAIYHDFPSPFIEVGHDPQDGADGYNLKRVVVAIGDPDPTDDDMPVDNFAEGLNADPYADAEIDPGDKCAYWMCGVQAGVEGEWTGPVIGVME